MSKINAKLRDRLRPVVPKMMELTESVLFGDIWQRPQLSKRERNLITVAALTALYRPEQLPHHLNAALDDGITAEELGEVMTHLAFYVGWPAAASGASMTKDVLEKRAAAAE